MNRRNFLKTALAAGAGIKAATMALGSDEVVTIETPMTDWSGIGIGHGFQPGAIVTVTGIDNADYNGTFRVEQGNSEIGYEFIRI